MKQPEGVMLYYDRITPWRKLSDADLGQVFRSVWNYAENGVIPELPQNLEVYFDIVQPSIETGKKLWWQKCIKNRMNKSDKGGKDVSVSEKAEWWANQPDYDPTLFEKEPWYAEALNIYNERLRSSTNDNDGNQTQNKTVTVPQHGHGHGLDIKHGHGLGNSPEHYIDTDTIDRGQAVIAWANQLAQKKGV